MACLLGVKTTVADVAGFNDLAVGAPVRDGEQDSGRFPSTIRLTSAGLTERIAAAGSGWSRATAVDGNHVHPLQVTGPADGPDDPLLRPSTDPSRPP